jgi:hypothetical protein
MTPVRFPGLLYTLAAIACVIAWVNSDSPDRIALMFAAVMFVVHAAASRIIAAVKEPAA